MSSDLAQARTTAPLRRSLEIGQGDLVAALCQKLGPKMVSFIAGRSASTVSRWRNEAVLAEEEALRPLRLTYQVVVMLETAEADATIRAWFMGQNPQLDDLSPAEAVEGGLNRQVMAAARAFLAGG